MKNGKEKVTEKNPMITNGIHQHNIKIEAMQQVKG
jgi:hypothetical protein